MVHLKGLIILSLICYCVKMSRDISLIFQKSKKCMISILVSSRKLLPLAAYVCHISHKCIETIRISLKRNKPNHPFVSYLCIHSIYIGMKEVNS